MKKNKWFKSIALFSCLAICLLVVTAFAQNNTSSATDINTNKSISISAFAQKIGVDAEEVNQVGTTAINGKQLSIVEDAQYIYKADLNKCEIANMVSKNYANLVNLEGNVSKSVMTKVASKCISRYVQELDNANYSLESYDYINTDSEKIHSFIYQAATSSGVKTGDSVAMEFNNNGDLLMLATHKGNETVALTADASISEERAHEIALNYINNGGEAFSEISNCSYLTSELSIWNNKLVWSLTTNPIFVANAEYGFEFKIDAQTGEILFDDGYCVVMPSAVE